MSKVVIIAGSILAIAGTDLLAYKIRSRELEPERIQADTDRKFEELHNKMSQKTRSDVKPPDTHIHLNQSHS